MACKPRGFLESVPPAEIVFDIFRKTQQERFDADRFDQLDYVADTDILNHDSNSIGKFDEVSLGMQEAS
ncbi:hypothetical protein D3C87_1799230 [compost metagenome]